jgi:hypothetical protein
MNEILVWICKALIFSRRQYLSNLVLVQRSPLVLASRS